MKQTYCIPFPQAGLNVNVFDGWISHNNELYYIAGDRIDGGSLISTKGGWQDEDIPFLNLP